MAEAVLFHVDLDAFYASVERRDDPSLQGKAIIVGARPGSRGVVSSCSYEARRFGVRSAMPIGEAYRRCPHGVFLPVRMRRYLEVSGQVMELLRSYAPVFQQLSIDEAFMDLSGTGRLYGPPEQLGERIKQQVRLGTGLTLSIGIAPNRYLAKLASEACKPDGLLRIHGGEEAAFLEGLPLARLWGVGDKTRQRLSELGIDTVTALRGLSEEALCGAMGEAGGRYLYRAARGIEPGAFSAEPKSRSLSSEMTFESDVASAKTIGRCLLELCQQVMYRLIKDDLSSNTVFLKLRLFDFSTTTAQKTVGHWLASSEELHKLVLELLGQRWDGSTPVRLIGVGAANVLSSGHPVQGELFEDEFARRRKVEEAVTRLRERMEGVRLTKASLIHPPEDAP
jgi:DNA polymerase-4